MRLFALDLLTILLEFVQLWQSRNNSLPDGKTTAMVQISASRVSGENCQDSGVEV